MTADAVRIARDGFPISQEFAEGIDEISQNFPGSIEFIASLSARRSRGRFSSKKVWATCSKKSRSKGRDGFYSGEIADKICATIKSEGGILAEEDLRSVVCQWLEPLSSTYRDTVVYEQPPVSQGFMVLEMLNIAEAWPMHDGTMSRADMIHYQVAAKKLAFEDRIRYLEDPAFGDPKIAMLISKEHAAKRRELVGDDHEPAGANRREPEQRHDLSVRHRPRRQREFLLSKACLRRSGRG